MLDPAAALIIIFSIALLLASAGWHQLRALADFRATFVAYRLLPVALSARVAWCVPVSELAIAVLLVMPRSRSAASLAGAGLLLSYAGGIALNLKRGRRDLDCGCSGPLERRPIAAWMVGRTLLLAAALTLAALPWSPRPLVLIDAVTLIGGVSIAALLYLAADRLLGQVMPRAAAWKGTA